MDPGSLGRFAAQTQLPDVVPVPVSCSRPPSPACTFGQPDRSRSQVISSRKRPTTLRDPTAPRAPPIALRQWTGPARRRRGSIRWTLQALHMELNGF